MIKVWFILTVSLLCIGANATEQIPETLIIDGVELPFQEYPLHHAVKSQSEITRALNPEVCTASYRGYRGYWELRDGFLWLSHIESNPCGKSQEVSADTFFHEESYPIKAQWYSGLITIRVGERKYLAETTEYDAVIFEILKGRVISKDYKHVVKNVIKKSK